jgi:hypothetical protein
MKRRQVAIYLGVFFCAISALAIKSALPKLFAGPGENSRSKGLVAAREVPAVPETSNTTKPSAPQPRPAGPSQIVESLDSTVPGASFDRSSDDSQAQTLRTPSGPGTGGTDTTAIAVEAVTKGRINRSLINTLRNQWRKEGVAGMPKQKRDEIGGLMMLTINADCRRDEDKVATLLYMVETMDSW